MIKAIKRVSIIAVALIVTLVALGWATAAYFFAGLNYSQVQSIDGLEKYSWYRVDTGADLVSSNGQRYQAALRLGDSDNLLIYFQGGGASWDAQSAARPGLAKPLVAAILTGNAGDIPSKIDYTGEIIWPLLSNLSGIFDQNRVENPVRDWNILFFPYATGDLHMGNADEVYSDDDGKAFTIHHHGARNTQAVLDWAFKQFRSPPKVLVAGSSAGGAGAAAWLGPVAKNYENASVYQYVDGIHLVSAKVTYAMMNHWGAAELIQQQNIQLEDDVISSFQKSHVRGKLPNVTFLHSNTTSDAVLVDYDERLHPDRFRGDMDGRIKAWSRQMRDTMADLLGSSPNYHVFLSDNQGSKKDGLTFHTHSMSSAFYDEKEDGVNIAEWLASAILKDQPFSVGQSFLSDLAANTEMTTESR